MTVKKGRILRIILYIAIGLVIVGFIVSRFFTGTPAAEYVTAQVAKGTISQTVSVTGTTESQVRYQLQFPIMGTLDAVLVHEGDRVKLGDVIAKLEGGDLAIGLEAQTSALHIAQANLAKALSGPRDEEINLGKFKVDLAKQDFNSALQDQNSLISIARSNLESARIALDQASQSYNAALQGVAFLANNDPAGRQVSSTSSMFAGSTSLSTSTTGLGSLLQPINDYFAGQAQQQTLQTQHSMDEAQSALTQAQLALQQAQNNYQKAAADYNRQINDLNSTVNKAGIGVQSAQEQLNLTQAKPRNVDVAPLKAQVDQAWDAVHLAQYRVSQTELKAPADGVIAKINNNPGEVVSAAQAFVVMDSDGLKVKALVSEADIAKIQKNENVKMTFDALDISKEFTGTVLEVSPAETVVQGVIYYEVKILIQNSTEQIKPGMTANLTIQTNTKADVLMVPVRAIQYEDNQAYVQVLTKDSSGKDQLEKRNVTTGIQGDENVEIVSGLNEGDQVVTFTKNK